MKKNVSVILLLALLSLSLIVPVMALNRTVQMGPLLKDKVTILQLPMAKPTGKPSNPVLSIEILYPEDGVTLEAGMITVEASASARNGIAEVQLKIDSPTAEGAWEAMVLSDGIYTYEWNADSAEGTYTLTAKVIDSKGKTATDSHTITFGTAPPPPTAGKWAVVIGIADYQGRNSDLWHPDEDAKEMANVLYSNNYASENVLVLLNRQATAQAIENAIDWLVSNEKEGDEIVFFYSGHGSRISETDPTYKNLDGDIESDGQDEMIVSHDFYGLTDGYLRTKFASVESTKFALMFGSCHSGGMFDDDDDLQAPGRVIAAACKADQYGWDILTLGNTAWGYYFVDFGLLDGNANSVQEAHAIASAYVPTLGLETPSEPQLQDNLGTPFVL